MNERKKRIKNNISGFVSLATLDQLKPLEPRALSFSPSLIPTDFLFSFLARLGATSSVVKKKTTGDVALASVENGSLIVCVCCGSTRPLAIGDSGSAVVVFPVLPSR